MVKAINKFGWGKIVGGVKKLFSVNQNLQELYETGRPLMENNINMLQGEKARMRAKIYRVCGKERAPIDIRDITSKWTIWMGFLSLQQLKRFQGKEKTAWLKNYILRN